MNKNMAKIDEKQQKIVKLMLAGNILSSSKIHQEIIKAGENVSLVTVKRILSQMIKAGLLVKSGAGRTTSYSVSVKGRVLADIDAKEYCSLEPDKRLGLKQYNFELLGNIPKNIFSPEELKNLNKATIEYHKRTKDLSSVIQKKELERLIIELSWKSSKIEGNTYTLLDTEKLILENKEAPGHDRKEARMILNHKEAFNYVRAQADKFKTLTRKNLEELHTILVKGLSVKLGLRQRPVGVLGSIYRPLDNAQQILEAVETLSAAVTKMTNPYAKALMAILGLSYIQPFEDGNKRTSRLLANAILLAYDCAPLSYRSVDENEYREAILVFYELNSIMPFKKIFMAQYEFAAKNYVVK
jgi:Fic family protein/predicted transcriptional regulator